MLPLQFSAAPKLFPSFDDYCTIYCSSICSGILLLLLLQLASQLAFGSTTILLRRPNYREFRKLLLQLHSYPLSLPSLRLLRRQRISHFNSFHFTHHSSSHTKEGATTQYYLNGQWRAPNPLVIATNQCCLHSSLLPTCYTITVDYMHFCKSIADVIVICGLC